MSETATQRMVSIDRQALIDRRTVHAIFHMVDRFIPDACRREAMDAIMKIIAENGLELTDRRMRLEYEAWKTTQLDMMSQQFPDEFKITFDSGILGKPHA